MKKTLLVACAMGASAVIGFAQTAAPNKIAIIQVQAAIVSTKEGQAAREELEKKLAPKQQDLEKRQNDIKDLTDRLNRGGTTMSQTAKDDLQRQIDSKTKTLNRDLEDAQADAELEQRKVIDELGQKLMQVVAKYTADKGIAIVLDVSNPQTPVLWASDTIDITKDIIDAYDKQAPTLTKTTSAAPAPAQAKPAVAQPKPPAVAPAKKQ